MLSNTKGQLYDVAFDISVLDSEKSMEDFLSRFGQVVQCAQIMCTETNAIVYARGNDESHFTGRLTFDREKGVANISLKCTNRELVNTLKEEVEKYVPESTAL